MTDRPAAEPTVDRFDLLAEIPPGVTVLEASAGTGKTYTIAGLATRFVADGVPLEQMLLVTFTRMATGELRERVRERLTLSEQRLVAALAAATGPVGRAAVTGGDELDRMLATGSPELLESRRRRLVRALAEFDAATIATTHGFCHEVLTGLGTLSDLEPEATLTEHVDDLLEEVVDDLYVRRFLTHRGRPPLSRAEAGTIARAAVRHPDAVLYPLQEPTDRDAGMRWRLAVRVRADLEQRKRRLGVITYDDLLSRLYATLTGPHATAAKAQLRARYRIVLIDEFQDTDPTQWRIVEEAFGDGERRLVLIADPKQAIYAFRGADVHTYLRAARTARRSATLGVNYRSDERLLAGFDALFSGVRLGHPDIIYRRVGATAAHRGGRLAGAPEPAALRFRVLDRSHLTLTPTGLAVTSAARTAVAEDVAADIVRLLDSGAMIEQRDRNGAVTGTVPVAPGDIAVLVNTHRNAAAAQTALEAASVPTVIAGAGSVFGTDAAGHWLTLLEALEQPTSSLRARGAALTPLLGWDAAALAGATPTAIEGLHRDLHRWARRFSEAGVAAMTAAVLTDAQVMPRSLGRLGGERLLTDLQHVAELLHRASVEQPFGLSALTAWLRERIAVADREGAHGDDRTRRLDSDAAAVQVLTIHRSKGLEWPVVYCPFLWDPRMPPRDKQPVTFHRDDQRAVDVTLRGPGFLANERVALGEDSGEQLRLAYVALTRARHRTVVHWAGTWAARDAALTRLLFARAADGTIAARSSRPTPSDAEVRSALTALTAAAADPAAIAVESAGPPPLAPSWSAPGRHPGALSRARPPARIDTSWRRTSYSALTAAAHEACVASEPEEGTLTDEPTPAAEARDRGPLTAGGSGHAVPPGAPDGSEPVEATLPLTDMALGPAVGTIVHRALDRADFAAADLPAELARALRDATGPQGLRSLGCPVETVATGLATALATPIHALGGIALAEVPAADRMDELTFELPLAGDGAPGSAVAATLAAVGAAITAAETALPELAGYGARLSDRQLGPTVLRGSLTGSIDLVLRLAGPGGHPRFAVIDYKTNWLAAPGVALSARGYTPAALALEMQRSHYLLQGLLYTVALHRLLRWRLRDYDPARDLAGLHYLFLRGMTGATGTGGVFSLRPPAALVCRLSDLLDGATTGEPEAGR
ncbi:UvrD-helicase domain-containing protein [Conexibacter sp. DBS9H8]|uniref:UvrD-helicase domain-containing protein n=1 Tax=Conexibacter sp. DBS9H8 TaxID=2937801 RepID=UPI00200E7C0F|nr:UvrD-helicase domain-containing protein [Conexibacter sp. DBS9H8]